ncbi:MAG: hypothetical protein LBI79_01645 [Nitrososphaerota archaeon]|nr:hypothetical protein [Nitrososphaerota archaeon]
MNWYIKWRLLIGGPILIALGLVLYFIRGTTPALVLPVLGVVLIIAGIIYKPKKKTKITP